VKICLGAVVILAGFLSLGSGARAAPTAAVPRPLCQPGDKPDTGLQGQIPLADRVLARATEGYSCNLKVVGGLEEGGGVTFDTYKNCAYVSEFPAGVGTIDVSDPADPRQTALLTGDAAKQISESMRVNATRGLLVMDVGEVAGPNEWHMLDVYDVKQDCAHPKRLGSFDLSPAMGHEGWFSPDGTVYYMATASGGRITGLGKYVFPIDLTDPSKPRLMATWSDVNAHGGSESDDGKTGYQCQQGGTPGGSAGTPDGVRIVDTSDVQAHHARTDQKVIGFVPTGDNSLCQATYPVTYHGRAFLIQFGESTPGREFRFGPQVCGRNPSNFAYPHIFDISDPSRPVLAGRLMREVDLPANCEAVNNDFDPTATMFGQVYDVHMCSPDRLHDPTILACAQFMSGLEVYDIRDPYHPKELAYYRMGTVGAQAVMHPQWRATPQSVEAVGARPVVRADRGQIWFVSSWTGFHVVRFENGVYPFRGSLSCEHDYFFDQYNPGRCARRKPARRRRHRRH